MQTDQSYVCGGFLANRVTRVSDPAIAREETSCAA